MCMVYEVAIPIDVGLCALNWELAIAHMLFAARLNWVSLKMIMRWHEGKPRGLLNDQRGFLIKMKVKGYEILTVRAIFNQIINHRWVSEC